MKRAVTAALTLVIGALGVACEDEPEPRITPTESSSAPPSEPTTPATTEPAKLSPEETVRAWVEARNEALRSGRVSEVRGLSGPDCTTCDDLIDPIVDVYDNGGKFMTDGWSVAGINVENQTRRMAKLQVALDMAGGRTVQEAGAEPVVYAAQKRIAVFRLSSTHEGWAVQFIGFLS